MNTKKIAFSLFATLALATTGLNADGGTLSLSGGGTGATVEFNQLNPNSTSGLTLNNILYTAAIQNPSSVSDAALEFDFSDTNLTSDVLSGTHIFVEDNNTVVGASILTFANLTSDGIAAYKMLGGDEGNIDTEKQYVITTEDGNDSNISFSFPDSTKQEVSLVVYSTSGTPTPQDSAKASVETIEDIPQFQFSCTAKFDALINFENNETSFVETGHGHNNSANQDTIVFSINNHTEGVSDFVEGNNTEVIISTDTNWSALGFNDDMVRFYGKQGATEHNGTATIINDGMDFNLSIDNTIPAGISTWYATIDTNLTATLSAAKFTMDSINLEGNTTVHPAIDYTADVPAGEWQNHAYIGQIPAVTNDANVQSKIFVVNRSCATATPEFRFIKDGVVTPVAGTAVAVNAQNVYKVADLLTAANLDAGRYAVEVVIPGIAEDFYVHAQAKGSTGFFKDLPVYNTSSRN